MALDVYPALPDDATFSYLAEGAANVVYKICIPSRTNPPTVIVERSDNTPLQSDDNVASIRQPMPFQDKLLRVRKDLPTTIPCIVGHAAWLRLIAPLFHPDQIVEQSLVELRPAGLISRLNTELRLWEQHPDSTLRSPCSLGHRPKSRRGIYLANDNYGLLITDMTCSVDSSEQVIEFKPKWLCQSLSAPANPKRCRQCARIARGNAERSRAGERLMTVLCPLDLVSGCLENLRIVSSQLLAPNDNPVMIERLTEWLKTNTLLKKLCSYQKQLDQKGVLIGDVKDENFLVAMALRDCTVFVKFPPKDSGRKVEARLGDLDLKSEGKKEYWRSTELALIEEGWYEGKESEKTRQPLTCQLSRER